MKDSCEGDLQIRFIVFVVKRVGEKPPRGCSSRADEQDTPKSCVDT